MMLEAESSFDPGANLCFSDVAVDDTTNPTVLKVHSH